MKQHCDIGQTGVQWALLVTLAVAVVQYCMMEPGSSEISFKGTAFALLRAAFTSCSMQVYHGSSSQDMAISHL